MEKVEVPVRPDKSGNYLINPETGEELRSVTIEVYTDEEFVTRFHESSRFREQCYSNYLDKIANAEKARVKNLIAAEEKGHGKVPKASWKKRLVG